MHDVESVLRDSGFWTALVVGAVGTALVWLRIRQRAVTPGVAIVVVVAGLAGFRATHALPGRLVAALGLLVLAECLVRTNSLFLRTLAFAPGAVVLGAALPDAWPFWIRAVAAATAIVGGTAAGEADGRIPRLVPALLAIGAAGVYVCVPDTEAPKVLVGAFVAAVTIGVERSLRHTTGFTAVVGLFAWTVAIGGIGRPGSVVGGVGCLGVVLLLALVRWTRRTGWPIVVLVLVQFGLVVFESRVAGFETSAWDALLLSVPAFALTGVVLCALARVAE